MQLGVLCRATNQQSRVYCRKSDLSLKINMSNHYKYVKDTLTILQLDTKIKIKKDIHLFLLYPLYPPQILLKPIFQLLYPPLPRLPHLKSN